ncbi:MAG: PulJ/GspJ family protein [Myxococcales bacterium]|jgi:type II secretory pathway pseudopilin PulG
MIGRAAVAARGFSLLEVGIVMGVASVLLSAVAVLGAGQIANARNERIGIELQSFARMGASAWLRGVNQGVFDFGWPLGTERPACFDLARSTPNCPNPVRMGGTAFNTSTLLAQLFTTNPPNGGFNPYCVSYQICLFQNRAEARTCVPESARALAGGNLCYPTAACPSATIDGERAFCVSAAVTPAFWKRSEAEFAIQQAWLDLNTLPWLP